MLAYVVARKVVRECGKFVGCEKQPTIVRCVSLLS
jgi:hypothetical protein